MPYTGKAARAIDTAGCQVHTRASGLARPGGHVMMWLRDARAFRWSTVSSSNRREEAQHGEGAGPFASLGSDPLRLTVHVR